MIAHCYWCGQRRFKVCMVHHSMKTPLGDQHVWFCSHHVHLGMNRLWNDIRLTYPTWYRQQIELMTRRDAS